LDQALQLFLKAKLLEEGADYPKTHSLLEIFLETEDKKQIIKIYWINIFLS